MKFQKQKKSFIEKKTHVNLIPKHSQHKENFTKNQPKSQDPNIYIYIYIYIYIKTYKLNQMTYSLIKRSQDRNTKGSNTNIFVIIFKKQKIKEKRMSKFLKKKRIAFSFRPLDCIYKVIKTVLSCDLFLTIYKSWKEIEKKTKKLKANQKKEEKKKHIFLSHIYIVIILVDFAINQILVKR
ncbi:hypothetical protein CROQUDRAFT_410532 [Cronartium quercuum f. sp. fusiforme G11]|uniref:Transmembrane protein n=1 Tax=Cronartium quercuum f. sp. fusiforme G11 TaxID=708437 RepID=A0A9P6NLV4_9BASI|nr:hypothetical protein CROQUDRAFT_410532 [Cronartium quercuum f. sp. fusiforme G11]